MSHAMQPPPHEGPPSFQSAAALAKAQEAEAHSRFVLWALKAGEVKIMINRLLILEKSAFSS